ncbi:MAG: 50S ribosomal protein L19, partial [Bacteroidetes bacterium]|nr:50S ribosomal protein L19 [Bacteroidota bacterium]
MERIKEISNMMVEAREWPKFGAGDTVTLTVKITEGKKERLQAFQGVV